MSELLLTLARLEAELHHPGVRCTRERLEQLLHPDFHEVGRSGKPYTRRIVIDHLASVTHPPPVESSGHAIERIGAECVLLTFRSALRRPDGSLVDAALRSSVWLQGEAGWQLRYHQGTPTD
ncbi:MAG: DUF4440 domain-containing protein [Burkholderiaceae bacterium]|jgi:hypothetical protein